MYKNRYECRRRSSSPLFIYKRLQFVNDKYYHKWQQLNSYNLEAQNITKIKNLASQIQHTYTA